jgi:ferredoxin
MKICVDYDKCAGHAVCESLDGEVFRLRDAVAECPTGALSIQE